MSRFIDHPRVALVAGLTLGGAGFIAQQLNAWEAAWICWVFAALVVLWSAVTAEPVRRRSQSVVALLPFRVQIAWRGNLRAPRIEVEKGFLDFEKAHLEGTQAATKTLQAFAAEMTRHTPKVVVEGAKLQQLQGAPVDKRLRATNRSARLIDRHASRFERLEKTYRAQSRAMTVNLVEMLNTTPATGSLGQLPDALATTAAQTTASRASTAGYRDAVTNMRQMRVSQKLNRSCDRLISVLDSVLEDSDAILKAYAEAQSVIAKRWPKPSPAGGPSASSKAGSQP